MLQLICFQLLSFVEFICSFLNHRQNVKVKLLNVMEKKKNTNFADKTIQKWVRQTLFE